MTQSLFPFAPNWRETYTVSYEFKTDIFTSRSGREQRRAQRTTPRKTLKFTTTRTEKDFRTLNAFLAQQQGELIAAPDLSRQRRLIAALNVGGITVSLDNATASWLAFATQVVIAERGRYAVRTIASVNVITNTVTFNTPSSDAWGAGAKLHPWLPGRLAGAIDTKVYGDRTAETSIVFNVSPGQAAADVGQGVVDVFNGREVFPFTPNYASALDGSFSRFMDVVDFGRGRTSTYLPVPFSARIRQFSLLAPKQVDREAIVDFFHRMKGQRGEFYLPTWEQDFIAAGSVASGGTTATFTGTDLHDTYQGDELHRAVLIERGGFRWARRVTATAISGANTVITTDTGWPCTIDARTKVCWLVVNRFAVDQIEMVMKTDEVGQAQISVTSLPDIPVTGVDVVFGGLDGAAQWVLDNWGIAFFDGEIADPFDRIVNVIWPSIADGAWRHYDGAGQYIFRNWGLQFFEYEIEQPLDHLVNVTWPRIAA